MNEIARNRMTHLTLRGWAVLMALAALIGLTLPVVLPWTGVTIR